MRYVPNLIPEKSKVLKNYFKGSIYQSRKPNKLVLLLGWFLGVFFLISAIAALKHPLLSILLGVLGLILIPPGHNWVERTLKLRLNTKVKSIFGAALFVAAFPLISHYNLVDKQEATQQKLIADQEEAARMEAEKKEQQRQDSLSFYIQASDRYAGEHKVEEGLTQLNQAQKFAATDEDRNEINREKIKLSAVKTLDLVKSGKYQTALPELNSLISQDPSNSDLLYNRAICYMKMGNIQEAVDDCKIALQNGNKDAETLNNKVNPVRKRVIGYETLCNDGTTSDARGSGACSHHGGVRNWNQPIYEEYRKYN